MNSELATKKGIVYLIGAGPGDPGLITVRGLECLRRADVVVYDYLANPDLLREAPAAEHLYVGKTRGCHHTPQEEINSLLADRAGQGMVVARLKGGDPFIFGRGGEEALFLAQTGIPFEVVPGVTAGFAAAAYAGIPLTHRDFTTSLGLVTGHEDPAKKMSSLDWEKLATGVGTLVFYMGMTNLPLIAEKLMAHGRRPQTPVAIVRWATTPRQQTLVATLETVVERVQTFGLRPPAVIIVGEVVGLRENLCWFENRPLMGRRILVTRTAEQAGSFAELLQGLGAEAIACPLIEIVPPADWAEVDAAIEDLPQTDFLVLTSVNAVDLFFARLRQLGRDARALQGVAVIAVGPKTAAAIAARGILPDLVPADTRAEGVVQALKAHGVSGSRILYPRAELAREVIPDELTAAGAIVSAPVLYRTLPPLGGGECLQGILDGGIDAITFTSSSTVENFFTLAGPEGRKKIAAALVSIGPQTSAALRRQGVEPTIEAKASTLEGMAEVMVEYFTGLRNQDSGIRKKPDAPRPT